MLRPSDRRSPVRPLSVKGASPQGETLPGAGWDLSPALVWALLVFLLAASLVPRVPWLANATATFNSDEAVDALVIQHLLHKSEWTLYNWDAHYYGIVEGLLTIPFLAVGLAIPLASKLGSLVGFLGLLVGVFLLGRRLYGPAAGLLAAALLVGFSPQGVQWSVLASGGYALVIAWGTFTVLQFDRLQAAPSRAKLFALGFLVGFGLYIYELFLVYVATLACAAALAALAAFPWRALPRALRSTALFLAGVALGWAPKLALFLHGNPNAGKKPLYALARPRVALDNLRLLVEQCIPAFLGIDPAGDPRLGYAVGQRPSRLGAALGLLLAVIYGIAWLAGALRVGLKLWRAVRSGERGGLDGETAIVLLVAIVAGLFILSPNPQDALSNRYLLPWLTSLPILAAALLVRLGRQGLPARALAWALGLLLVVFPLVQIARWHQDQGYLDARLHLLHPPDPLAAVVRYLGEQGIAGGYGSYWIAYKATLLSGERIVVTPLLGWDRYPPYSRRVAALGSEAYIFDSAEDAAKAGFPARLAGRPFVARTVAGHLVYTSPEHRRLLPPLPNPRPLVRLRAGIAAQVPATARPGETLVVPVTVTNRSDGDWSDTGAFDTGLYRVAVSYRWQTLAGRSVVAEGERFHLPRTLPPGASATVLTRIPVPAAPGSYRLRLTLVQEGVGWFDDTGGSAADFRVEVAEAGRKAA